MSVPAPGAERPLLLICSCGGHLMQLVGLRRAWEGYPRVWVTFDKPDSRSLLDGERVVYAHGPTNRNLPNLARNLRLARRVVRDVRPAAVLTTGAGLAVPFAGIARAAGVPVVYVESLTRIRELSLSGRLIAPLAAEVFVQWPELADARPGARYAGTLLGAS